MDLTFVELQRSITALAGRVDAIDIRRFESHPPDVLAIELSPLTMALLGDAQRVIAGVMHACESAIAHERPPDADEQLAELAFERTLDAAVARRTRWTVEAIGDIAFLAGLELRQRSERLEVLSGCNNHQAIIGECDSALRRIRKALMTIDRSFARAGIADAQLDFASELEVSLEVRRAYATLRSRVKAVGTPEGDTFHVQLRAIGTALAAVVGWKGYSNLRVRDRMQLRALQRRLLDWFRTEGDLTAGHRLWQDLDYFVQMLANVNHRQELKEHDAHVLDETWPVVVATDEALPPSTLKALEALEGLDQEVDALLASDRRHLAAAWVGPLERIRQCFARRGAQ